MSKSISQRFPLVARAAGMSVVVGLAVMAGIAYAAVPVLSRTNIAVGLGQSVSVTSQNGISVYMLSNSGPTAVYVSISGTQVTVTGQALGMAVIAVCAVGTSSDCANLSVTVQAGSVTSVSLSQSNLPLSISGSQSVTVSGGNGTYSVSSNSNTSVASANLSSSTLTVSGLAAGSSTITVCDTSNSCGTLSVSVNSSSASGLSFSQNNLSLAAGNNRSLTVSGGNGTYAISSNSNSSVVSTNLSGNVVMVNAIAAGSATIAVCDTANVCGTLYVTITTTTAANANQAVVFNVTNPTLTVGQSLNVAVSGVASSYIIFSNANANVVQASMTNSVTLSLYGASVGTGSLTICAVGGAGCSALSVTVTGATTTIPAATATTVIQTTTPTAQSGTAVVNSVLLAQIQTLKVAVTQVLTQIQSIQAQLNQLEAQVNAGSGSVANANANAITNTSYNFTELLTAGSENAQVTALQQRLTALGFYSGPVTGLYGALTKQAVIKYQGAHGIAATGSVGPSTRAALNAGN